MIRISKKLRGYLDKIEQLAWAEVTRQTTDEGLMAKVEAINTYCNLADALDADRTELRAHMT